MADKTIGQLNPLLVPMTGATLIEVEHLGVSYKATGAELMTFIQGGGGTVPVVGSNSGIMWGINGHAGRGGTYTNFNLASQMNLANQMGFKAYRHDLYDASSPSQTILRNVINAAAPFGITVLPILLADISIGSYADNTTAYAAGYAMGQTYGTNFKDYVHTWEIGNEWNGKVGSVSGQGTFVSDYDAGNIAKVSNLARGLIEGLKSVDSLAKCVFGSADGAAAWGFNDAVWAQGVRWDITAIHFYDAGPNEITALPLLPGTTNLLQLNKDRFGKPIWITEHNYYGTGADSVWAAYLAGTMPRYDGYAKQYGLEGVFIYELLREPEAAAGVEQLYGICSNVGVPLVQGTTVSNYLAAHPAVKYSQ